MTPLQIWLGDASGKTVFAYQPAKGAAIEGHWRTNPSGEGAPWAIVAWPDQARQRNDWALNIPDALSWLATDSLTGKVVGLRAFPAQDQPPLLPLLFYAFRVMAGIGFALALLMLWTVLAWLRGRLSLSRIETNRWLLRAWVAAVPLGYIAVDTGWAVREVGRQPWVIYGLLRTQDAASDLPSAGVAFTAAGYFAIDLLFLVLFWVFLVRVVRRGPDLTLPLPEREPGIVETVGRRATPGET